MCSFILTAVKLRRPRPGAAGLPMAMSGVSVADQTVCGGRLPGEGALQLGFSAGHRWHTVRLEARGLKLVRRIRETRPRSRGPSGEENPLATDSPSK